MRKLQKIFGLLKLVHRRQLNERGFVFLELMIGLPLIVMLLWSMNNLFVNSWYKCKFMVADFVLQEEMESAMARIVEAAEVAYKLDISSSGESVTFMYHKLNDIHDLEYIDIESNNKTHDSYTYFKNDRKICRGSSSNPITGDSWLSETNVTKFECHQIASNPKLLHIRLEAKSTVSNHNIILTSEVFMRGLK